MMTRTARMSVFVLAVLALACAAPLHAQDAKSSDHPMSSQQSKKMPSFATKAARGGLAEVQLGQLAAEKATDPDVKSFAQRMVTDHTKANDELQQLASSKGWTLPSTLDAKARGTMAKLEKDTGAAFDRAYMNAMVADHNADVAAFRGYSKSGRDAELRSWAGSTLPTLEEHQKMAKETAGKLGRSAKK